MYLACFNFFKIEKCIQTLKGCSANNPWHQSEKQTGCKKNITEYKPCYLFENLPSAMYDSPSKPLVSTHITRCFRLLHRTRWKIQSPLAEKHSNSGAWGDMWASLHRQCLVYFLCSRFLSEVVLNNPHLDGFKHRLTRKKWMRSGRHSQTCRLFVRMGSGVEPEDIKQRSRRCCYRWVGRSWLFFSCLCVCACVCGKRTGMHMCNYGGGRRRNGRDELMTICPLSRPWGLEDSLQSGGTGCLSLIAGW